MSYLGLRTLLLIKSIVSLILSAPKGAFGKHSDKMMAKYKILDICVTFS